MFFYFQLAKIKKHNNYGFAIFKYNIKKHALIRITAVQKNSNFIFDNANNLILKNKFYKIDTLLNFLDKNIAATITQIINNQVPNVNVVLNSPFKNIVSKQNFFAKKNINFDIHIKRYENSDEFIISLYLTEKINIPSIQYTNFIQTHNELFEYRQSKFICFLAFNPQQIINPNNHYIWKKLTQFLNLKQHQINFFYWQGLIFIFFNKINTLAKLKKVEKQISKKIIKLNANLKFKTLVKNITLFSDLWPSDPKTLIDLIVQSKYILLTSTGLNPTFKTYFAGDKSSLNEEKINEFIVKNADYEQKIDIGSFVKEYTFIIDVNNDKNNDNYNISLVKIAGINLDDVNFLNQINFNKIKYDTALLKYQLDTAINGEPLMIFANEFVLYNNLSSLIRPNTLYILQQHGDEFNFDLIDKIIEHTKINNDIKIGLYIENINIKLNEYLRLNKIKNYVVSAKLTKKIVHDTEIFLKLVDFVQNVNQLNDVKIYWENLPDNIEEYYKQHLCIKYRYTNKFN
ncbi:hypothetical protein EG856_00910 [Mycoplasmopsis phocirhinis]|uniref:Uncharacterized protein n=2 Tax=Mycoplasmopsis phocirhinis TaxID=142650 RepID=A0A4P6MNM2_9BACT|nr:hypothetical protein [Mycoplasmopsis phocirhinis]QBF34490.1 hypothetical protein EG856_00910 [Mycoplasmopsis phocirhinis]